MNLTTSAALTAALALLLCQGIAQADTVRVEFRFQHETASLANLAGTFNGRCDASGVYFFRLAHDERTTTRNGVLLR